MTTPPLLCILCSLHCYVVAFHCHNQKNGTCEPRLCAMCSDTHFPWVSKLRTLARPKADQSYPSQEEAHEVVHWDGSWGVRWSSHHHQAPQVLGWRWWRPFSFWWLYVEQRFCGSLQKVDSRSSGSIPSCKGLNFEPLCSLTHPLSIWVGCFSKFWCCVSVSVFVGKLDWCWTVVCGELSFMVVVIFFSFRLLAFLCVWNKWTVETDNSNLNQCPNIEFWVCVKIFSCAISSYPSQHCTGDLVTWTNTTWPFISLCMCSLLFFSYLWQTTILSLFVYITIHYWGSGYGYGQPF